jgi:rRNA maturation endonuclease Nob1
MKLAVTDANIFIDLIHLDLINAFFSINLNIYTTHEILEELNENQQAIITLFETKNQIKIESPIHSSNQDLKIPTTRLSSSDISAIILASQLNAKILSGDRLLRKIAEENKIEVNGILWIIESMIFAKIISSEIACEKAQLLMKLNKRMPADECKAKIVAWKKC